MKKFFTLSFLFYSLFFFSEINAQSPGLIVRMPGGSGVTPLNPNGDGYSSASPAGFSSDDIAQSEVAYKVVPAAITEPTGDLSTGPSGGFTDIVTRVDGSGFYLYKNATNIYFRLRIGGIISGSKGYSVLIDTDDKMGGSGPNADPNYVAPSGSSPGNPGFEYEVVLQTNFQVSVYNINGTASPGSPATYSLSANSQISVALSTDGNNPDYFYDWFVPLTAIGNPASVRLAVTTVTSPNSALQGSRSDIYGIDDAAYTNTPGAWETVINAEPVIDLTTFTGVAPTCTAAPVLNGPISTGSGIAVTGTWTRLSASKPSTATITLYKNSTVIGTTSAATGTTWSITVGSVANGDVFYAKALSATETECLQSNNIVASSCLTVPASPVLTCASLKGISGTMPSTASGNTVSVYLVPASNASPASNLISTGANLTYPTTTSFSFYTNGCSGGTNNVATGVYMIITNNGSCSSAATFVCVTSGSSGTPPPLSSNALTITQPIYPTNTSISGSGAVAGEILRLFINGKYNSTITAAGSSFAFSGLVLNAGDQLCIYSQIGTACMTQSSIFTVNCFSPVPAITTNATGNLLTGATSVNGTSAYPGASIQLYKGTAPSGIATGSPVTVTGSGSWTVAVTALVSGDNYYATQTVNGCTSAASSTALVLTPTACPTISGAYTDADITVTGTMPAAFTGTIRLYEDGSLIGSQNITTSTSWSITVTANALYYNGILSATAQSAGNAESTGCTNKIVGCTSPAAPSITPVSTIINAGQTVNYTVNNVTAGSWYALMDNSGASYATSLYRSTGSNFNLLSNSFTMPGTYNLKLSADALTGCPSNFALATVTVSNVLPLYLLSFSGYYENNRSVFSWSTTGEKNVSHFELQESEDGSMFSMISRISLQTTTEPVHNYHHELNKQLRVATYYRLRIVDNDGKEQYSRIIRLTPGDQQGFVARVSPNPFSDVVYINYTSVRTGLLKITFADTHGRIAKSLVRTVNKGENILEVSNLQGLNAGIYFIIVDDENNQEKKYFKVQKLK